MKFYYSLYVDEKLSGRKEEIQKKLRKNRLQFQVNLIMLACHEQNHLEIIDSVFLQQKRLYNMDPFIVGIASSKERAIEMVERILQEVYDESKDADIRNYILRKQEEYEKEKYRCEK